MIMGMYNKENKSFCFFNQKDLKAGWEGFGKMKSTGIIRKVDDLGRIVLPIELRRMLDIAERDELEIFVENDRIVLSKYEPACIFCGSSRDLVTLNGKNVCKVCVEKLSGK